MGLKSEKIDILGVKVDDVSEKEAVFSVLDMARMPNRGKYVVTVNAEFVMKARRDRAFKGVLNGADLAVADGWGVAKLKLILGGKEQKPVPGVDLVENLCRECGEKAVSVGFLGGFDEVAEEVKQRQKTKFPKLIVKVSESGDPTTGYDLKLKSQFSKIGRVDVLFVAYGMGQQEFWIDRMKDKLDVGVYIGVGGTFDYIAGVKKRAPKWMRGIGLEWLWRLMVDPARVWRMRVLPVFGILAIREFLLKKA